ncbi:hypothetical protein Taro_003980 [Colocasia esculenta]|uniref:Uncharacterized protein n=1 Tax=Colocasia esculenta TaxID=4460 RepID=A0A843TIR2_COLES|nr:hypothetical protein [Colocasia esculenta]
MTSKSHRCLNTLHQTLRDEFTSCWGHEEELLAAGEQENEHTKPIVFPIVSASGMYKPSTWSRPRSTTRVGLRTSWESEPVLTAVVCPDAFHAVFPPKVIMKFKKRSKSRMGMRPSDEHSNYKSKTLITQNSNGSQPMASYARDRS